MVLFCSESSETFFVNEGSQRIDSCHQNVNSEVKLQSIDQIRLVQVFLSYVVLTLDHPLVASSKENPFTLTKVFRLYYKSFGPLISELIFETFRIGR